MTKLIGEVEIFGVTFPIEEIENLHDEGKLQWGYVTVGDPLIRVDSKLGPDEKRRTIWHEILHAILTTTGHRGEHPEGILDALALGVDMIIENSSLELDIE